MKMPNQSIILLLGCYFVISLITYPIIMVRLEDFTVFATLYIVLYVFHELFVLLSLIAMVVNIRLRSKALAIISAFLMVIAGALIYPSLIVLLPLALVGFTNVKKP